MQMKKQSGGGMRAASVGFVLVTVFIDVLTMGIAIPVLPELIKGFSGGDAVAASGRLGLLVASFAATQFLCAPILGNLSDRFGRRPVILLSILGTGLDHLLLAFAPSIVWLFVGRVLAGATAANISAVYAYVADVADPELRAKNFGRIGAALGLGFIIGPALGGLVGEIDPRLPFLVAAGLAGLNFLYGLLVLPESLAPANRRPFSWRRANPVGSLVLLRSNPVVLRLALVFGCVALAFGAFQAVWVLYTAHHFGWTTADNGLTLTAFGLASAVVQGRLVTVAIRRLGEPGAMVASLWLKAVAYLVYALAPRGWVMVCGVVPQALGEISRPTLQSTMTRAVGPDQQGSLQGALSSLDSLVLIPAPVLGAMLFSASSGADAAIPFAGLPFLAGAVLSLAAAVVAWRTVRRTAGRP